MPDTEPETSNRDSDSAASPEDGDMGRVPMRLLGSGMELASYTLLLGAAGYWVDSQLRFARPYVSVAGALLGFVLGMYRLISLATRAS